MTVGTVRSTTETVGVGTRKDMPVSLPLTSGQHQADGPGGAGRRRDDVDRGRAPALPVLLRGAVHRLLGGGVGVDRRHQALLDAESLLQEHVDDGGQAVRRAGGVGDDVVLGGVVLASFTPRTTVMSSPLAGAEMMTFFAPAARWPLAFSASVKRPVDSITTCTPRAPQGNSAGVFALTTLISWPFTTSTSSSALSGADFFERHRAVEAALRGVVLEQVGQVVGRHDVAYGDHIELRAQQALFNESAEYQPADAAETIDSNFDSHGSVLVCVL